LEYLKNRETETKEYTFEKNNCQKYANCMQTINPQILKVQGIVSTENMTPMSSNREKIFFFIQGKSLTTYEDKKNRYLLIGKKGHHLAMAQCP
jgi:hypothetical protein